MAATITVGSGIPIAGKDNAITTTPAAFAPQLCTEVVVQASNNNSDWVLLGDATSQLLELIPGQSLVLLLTNMSLLWRASRSGTQTVNWLVRT